MRQTVYHGRVVSIMEARRGRHLTFQANISIQAVAVSTPSRLLAMRRTAFSRAEVFKRRSTDAQTSAAARCTSEPQVGKTAWKEDHVCCKRSKCIDGTRRYLKSPDIVANNAVSAGAGMGRERKLMSLADRSP